MRINHNQNNISNHLNEIFLADESFFSWLVPNFFPLSSETLTLDSQKMRKKAQLKSQKCLHDGKRPRLQFNRTISIMITS